ncbi:hypothetical protein [Hymenobacter lapidiphilus]|uniref:STAS domain-containing protein n=1 Tax=Hymenobacter lapidiphilus TaxID=2608003 RepID=A0A7Y7PM05_9BACT|nr:hypothetical protein [Hymenobacter lapidiphilus]NVO30279.1 hypothetical protein [Hymenobacter lapidiphilus]
MASPATAVPLAPVHLADLTAKQLAGLLAAPPAQLAVDCRWLPAPHPLGVGRFVSQLLALRSRGTRIHLAQVHPVLARCLHQLALSRVFHLQE